MRPGSLRRHVLTRLVGAVTLLGLLTAILGSAPAAHAQTASRLFIAPLVSLVEGNSGSSIASFSVTLSPPSDKQVTVQYSTANNTALAPGDYQATSGTLVFLPAETSKVIAVLVNGDALNEANESFLVNLSNPINADLSNTAGRGQIVNDDGIPSLTLDDVTVIEGTDAGQNAVFTVELSAPSGREVRVAYTTVDDTAVADSDYTATTGTLVFPAESDTAFISVPITPDTDDEANETFIVELSAPVNAVITADTGTGTILDDDGPPALSITLDAVWEGDSGTTDLVFTINLQPPSASTVTVDFATSDGSATMPADYTAVAVPGITFEPGQTSHSVSVPVVGDTLDEVWEYFVGTISNPSNVTISEDSAFGYIVDDDGPGVSVDDVTVTEGSGGTTIARFAVSLSTTSPDWVVVWYRIDANTALDPTDFLTNDDYLIFLPGEQTQTVDVTIIGDNLDEPEEHFFFSLVDATEASIVDAQGVGTIVDDDAAPTISIGDASVTEGNSGKTAISFTVSLAAASGQQVGVHYASDDGSAISPDDYDACEGDLTFAPGLTSKAITCQVKGDRDQEGEEVFLMNLSDAVGATIGDGSANGTIANDDIGPSPNPIFLPLVLRQRSGLTAN